MDRERSWTSQLTSDDSDKLTMEESNLIERLRYKESLIDINLAHSIGIRKRALKIARYFICAQLVCLSIQIFFLIAQL
jgi:hypothetical protein